MDFNHLSKLYRTAIMDYAGAQTHRYTIEQPTHTYEIYNPSCGDVLSIQAIIHDNKIEEIAFMGEGCAISMASAHLMCELLKGQPLPQAQTLEDSFKKLMTQSATNADKERLQEAKILEGVAQFPMRIRCATLGWEAFEEMTEEGDHDE